MRGTRRIPAPTTGNQRRVGRRRLLTLAAAGAALTAPSLRSDLAWASPAPGNFPNGGPYSRLEPIGKRGGRMTEGLAYDVDTFNPLLTTSTVGNIVTAMMFNALISINPDNGLPFANLAEDVPTRENGGVSADGLTYTFRLRTNVRWHDGTPFTADDVVFTYSTLQKPELGSLNTAQLNARLAAVTASDSHTVVFRLKAPVASFLDADMHRIVPAHILGSVPVDKIRSHAFGAGDPAATIGTGPFRFVETAHDDHTLLARHPQYFRGAPALDEYVFKVGGGSALAAAALLKTGEIDYSGVGAQAVADVSAQPQLTVQSYKTLDVVYVGLLLDRTKTTLFVDRNVRAALAYALDREAMVRAINLGHAEVAYSSIPPASWGYAPAQITTRYSYNPTKAAQLLDEAGWRRGPDGIRAKDGQPFSFTLWGGAGLDTYQQWAAAIQQQWKAVGIDATIKTEEFQALLHRYHETHTAETWIVGRSFDVDPDQSDTWECNGYPAGRNYVGYCNPRVDELYVEGLRELSSARRKQLYLEAENLIAADTPMIFLYHPDYFAAFNKRVHNVRPNDVNTRWNAHLWWVE